MLSLALLIGAIPFASATEVETIENAKIVDYIIEDSRLRGVDKPTQEWDWDDGTYWGSFSEVQYGIYTNYYFTGVDNLEVVFSALNTDDSINYFYFCLTDLTDSTGSSSQTQKKLTSSSSYDSAFNSYSDLDPTHKYCVWMRTSGGAVSGTIRVKTY